MLYKFGGVLKIYRVKTKKNRHKRTKADGINDIKNNSTKKFPNLLNVSFLSVGSIIFDVVVCRERDKHCSIRYRLSV